VHIDDLCRRFGYSRGTIKKLILRGLVPPARARGRYATYGPEHVEALAAYQALIHNNTSMPDVALLCREEGISIVEYTRRREASIRFHGLAGIA
jgi:DNA-binding transcriptional MerR regulator